MYVALYGVLQRNEKKWETTISCSRLTFRNLLNLKKTNRQSRAAYCMIQNLHEKYRSHFQYVSTKALTGKKYAEWKDRYSIWK